MKSNLLKAKKIFEKELSILNKPIALNATDRNDQGVRELRKIIGEQADAIKVLQFVSEKNNTNQNKTKNRNTFLWA